MSLNTENISIPKKVYTRIIRFCVRVWGIWANNLAPATTFKFWNRPFAKSSSGSDPSQTLLCDSDILVEASVEVIGASERGEIGDWDQIIPVRVFRFFVLTFPEVLKTTTQ